jgi:hypothetical protein
MVYRIQKFIKNFISMVMVNNTIFLRSSPLMGEPARLLDSRRAHPASGREQRSVVKQKDVLLFNKSPYPPLKKGGEGGFRMGINNFCYDERRNRKF